VPWPESATFAWGAWIAGAGGERLVGAVTAERHAATVMLHGPVVAIEVLAPRAHPPPAGQDDTATTNPMDPLDIAAQLLAAALDHATALGAATVYARPQGLDRIWVRFGFIPVPEVALPPALAGRPGAGLYAWRGGSALWTLREAASG
jgi:hypothetical protein